MNPLFIPLIALGGLVFFYGLIKENRYCIVGGAGFSFVMAALGGLSE